MITCGLFVGLTPASGATSGADALSPGVNFYTWANREWLKKTVIPADKPRTDNFSQIEDTVTEQLRDLLVELKAASV